MTGTRGVNVTFWGVRGSTPCEGPQYERYGGHSSCVSLEVDGQPPIIFDLGTGLTPYGERLGGARTPIRASVLLTHLHWDHVQGLPFFTPLHHPDSLLDVYGPAQTDGALCDVFGELMRPPFFPIRAEQLKGDLRWHDLVDDDLPVGQAKVRTRVVRHVGTTLGYRVDWNGGTVVYISDHGQSNGDPRHDRDIPHEVLELCDGADLLIHDAQHTQPEFEAKRGWGHCTYEYALHVAREAGVRQLALFHHCPSHDDDALDCIARATQDLSAQRGGPEVFAAAEMMSTTVVGRR
jgi:phosphoribosyl 1,2-cyclic phosphodiesterase